MADVPRLSIALVTIVVDDYEEALRFYMDALGFDLVEDSPVDGKRWVVVAPPGSTTGLLLAVADGEQQQARVGDQTGGRVGFFLYTSDFDASHRRMTDAGVRFLEEPRREVYGTVAVFADLYGNKWDLLQPSNPHESGSR